MNVLAMLARYWQPGAAKTRLAAGIGPRRASEIYRAFLETLVARLEHLGDERWLLFTPPEARPAFASLVGPNWQLAEQTGGDLGERMSDCFTRLFVQGATRVVLIGSDSPNLPLPLVDEAFQRLRDTRVVLSSTPDGGYCLIGASDAAPPIFDGIAWSSASVFGQTVRRLEREKLPYQVLPGWYDIDTCDDLDRLRGELAATDDLHLAKLRQALGATGTPPATPFLPFAN